MTLATPQAFRRNPELVWQWYAQRREAVGAAQPNAGHLALVEIEARVAQCAVITQNVDGLHQRAGSREVLELHGNLFRTRCLAEDLVMAPAPDDTRTPPLCPRCGSLLRPDIVWFGEALDEDVFDAAMEASFEADLFLCIGTSGVVQPAASLPLEAGAAGAVVVEINPEETELTEYLAHSLRGKAGQVLPELVAAAWPDGPASSK
jgi:NAD-dependent deacetylase